MSMNYCNSTFFTHFLYVNERENEIWATSLFKATIKTSLISQLTLSSDATHGSLVLKAYQQNLYLKYYY